MKTSTSSFLIAFFITVLLTSASAARAQGKVPKPPRLHLSLTLANDHLLQGEPVVLRYEIHTEGENLSLPFEQKAPWLHVELQDLTGKVLASTDLSSVRGAYVQSRQTQYNKEQRQEQFGVVSYRPFTDNLLIGDKRLPVPDAGTYQIVVEATSLWSAVPNSFGRYGHGTRGEYIE